MIEKIIVDTLRTACAIDAWFGAQPQGSDEVPSEMPVVIVNRIEANWLSEFCGFDDELAITGMQVDYYAETAEAARRLSDKGRKAMKDLTDPADSVALCPTLETEASFYDAVSRAWRVMQLWLVNDYQPALP
jgi:hypothetical protein